MAKQTVTAHVFMERGYQPGLDGRTDYSHQSWAPTVWKCRVNDEEHRVYIGEQQVTIDAPEDFDPVPGQVAALEREKLAALELYQRTVAQINERLSKLLAITNEVQA
jgi:hypothetical protein